MYSLRYPQGTILDPILFIPYINGLFFIEGSVKVLAYTDDTLLFYKANSCLEIKQKIEQ